MDTKGHIELTIEISIYTFSVSRTKLKVILLFLFYMNFPTLSTGLKQ